MIKVFIQRHKHSCLPQTLHIGTTVHHNNIRQTARGNHRAELGFCGTAGLDGCHIYLKGISNPGGCGILAPRLCSVPIVIAVVTESDRLYGASYRYGRRSISSFGSFRSNRFFCRFSGALNGCIVRSATTRHQQHRTQYSRHYRQALVTLQMSNPSLMFTIRTQTLNHKQTIHFI
ncbi:hypothetical protein D3C75_1016240 [compost metagenome]